MDKLSQDLKYKQQLPTEKTPDMKSSLPAVKKLANLPIQQSSYAGQNSGHCQPK